jgi:hypothetical protein
MAAGLAASFASPKMPVTLLETGPGLPNAGYYFALTPERYLRPVLDNNAVVEAEAGGSLRILCSRDPSVLKSATEPGGTGPRVILMAFDWPGRAGDAKLEDLLGPIHGEIPAFLLTVSDRHPGNIEGLSRQFDALFPGAPALALFPGDKDDRAEGVEPCPFPEEMMAGLNSRKPPASPFLSGLTGEILQRLGSRKRGSARDRTG